MCTPITNLKTHTDLFFSVIMLNEPSLSVIPLNHSKNLSDVFTPSVEALGIELRVVENNFIYDGRACFDPPSGRNPERGKLIGGRKLRIANPWDAARINWEQSSQLP
uniref:Uncharacterized protein n=1 Tax=Juglanconis oblonga TaxID=1940568 RepID=A0A291LI98_9PEZI|nr:hypothetical protein [Juglanconis oblonga]ATI20386.1 hypothetical protein [Juglanconis oblonga]